MKKKIIILLLACALPTFAQDEDINTDVINTGDVITPVIQEIKPDSNAEEKGKKRFTLFKRKSKEVMAKEVEVIEPDKKTLKEMKDAQKQSLKKAKKQQIEQNNQDVSAVNKSGEKSTILSDIAYQGGINANKILKVDECVKIAMEKHPAIQSAMGNADIYKSRIAQAWSAYFPTFSAGISYSRNDMQVSNVTPPVQRYDMFYVPEISANMLIFDFGKTKAAADLAKRSWESAQYSLEYTINTVVYNVKQAYYNLLFALSQVKVYEDTVKDYELHLEQAQEYYNIGKKPKIDVLTAEYNLGKAKLNLIQANNTLKIAYVELSNAMGLSDYADYDVVDNLTTKAYDITVEKAVNTAYETSPELLAAKKKADASEVLVRSTIRAFTPDISGFASYTRGGKKVDTDDGYQIGAQISYTSINLLLLKKQVDEAKANYKKDFADYQNLKQNIYFEVKQAYLNLVTAQESITVSRLSMEQAKEQYNMASGRYKVGLGDVIELKDAETTFRNSQLDYYNTLLKYHVSAANLERLMGVPLEQSNVELL